MGKRIKADDKEVGPKLDSRPKRSEPGNKEEAEPPSKARAVVEGEGDMDMSLIIPHGIRGCRPEPRCKEDMAKRYGLKRGIVLDLRSRNESGEVWDGSKVEVRNRIREQIGRCKPVVVI